MEISVNDCLEFLIKDGWSDLIDSRWTIESYRAIWVHFKGKVSRNVIEEALDIVVYPKPNYDIEYNEFLQQ